MLYFAFDLLHLDGRDLRGLPLVQRKEALKALLAGSDADARVRYSEHHAGQEAELFLHACRLRLEGTVSKRHDAPYRSGRDGDWLKTKCTKRQELVVGGWRPSTAPGRDLRSVLLGYYDCGNLRYAGKVGTGFGIEQGGEVVDRLLKHERPRSPFAEQVPRADARGARWVDPVTVAEVEFTEGTEESDIRRSRHSGGQGCAREVTIERPADR